MCRCRCSAQPVPPSRARPRRALRCGPLRAPTVLSPRVPSPEPGSLPRPGRPPPWGTPPGGTSRVSSHRPGAEGAAANLPAAGRRPPAAACPRPAARPRGCRGAVNARHRRRTAPPPPPRRDSIATGTRRPALTPASKMAAPAPGGGGRCTHRSGGRRCEREGAALPRPCLCPPLPASRRRRRQSRRGQRNRLRTALTDVETGAPQPAAWLLHRRTAPRANPCTKRRAAPRDGQWDHGLKPEKADPPVTSRREPMRGGRVELSEQLASREGDPLSRGGASPAPGSRGG